jgi:cell division cycle 20-like protein 1 (cofactor of APC complex)
MPYKVLDAPELKDDFYLNLVDWGAQNILAVGLGSSVYLWHAGTGNVKKLVDLGDQDHITGIGWMQRGTHLAVGTNKGLVRIWDTESSKAIRTMTGHSQRVGIPFR